MSTYARDERKMSPDSKPEREYGTHQCYRCGRELLKSEGLHVHNRLECSVCENKDKIRDLEEKVEDLENKIEDMIKK